MCSLFVLGVSKYSFLRSLELFISFLLLCVSRHLADVIHMLFGVILLGFYVASHFTVLLCSFLLLVMTFLYSSLDLSVRRRCVKRPIHRYKLVSMIMALSNYNCNPAGSNFCNVNDLSWSSSNLHILGNIDVSVFFGLDRRSLNVFHVCGGILIRTQFARQFALRYRALGDIAFWRFWDVVIMQSGWYVLEVKRFNDVFNKGVYSHICLVRRLPSSLCSSCSQMIHRRRCVLCSLHRDSLSSCDIVYSAISEIDVFLRHKYNKVGIYGDRPRRAMSSAVKFSNEQVHLFRHKLQFLRRIIAVRDPVADILLLLLDIYALATCLSTSVPFDFDARNIRSVADLLESQVRYFLQSCLQAQRIESLFSEIDEVAL